MNVTRKITLAIMFTAALTANTMQAQDLFAGECSGNDPVEGVVWDIATDNAGRTYATGNGGVLKSCDDGNTWTRPATFYAPGLAILVSPTNPAEIYFGSTARFYRSSDFGDTFSTIGSNIADKVWSIGASSAGTLFAGTENAIYRSDDGGDSWQAIPGSPAGYPIQALAVDYSNNNVMFAGSNGAGLFRSIDGGATWNQQSNGMPVWQVKEIVQDPVNPAIIFAASWDGLWRSADGGTSWLNIASVRVTDIAFHPANSTSIYAVSRASGVMRSTDGGNTWSSTSPLPGVPVDKIYSIAVLESGRLLVGTEFFGLYASDDAGNTWHIAGAPPPDEPAPPGGNSGGGITGPDVQLYATIEFLGSGSVPAGQDARFKVTIRNEGTAASDYRYANIAWFRSPLVGQIESFDYTISTTQGHCYRNVTPEPDCAIGPVAAGSSVTILINGKTAPGRLGWYTLRAAMLDSQGNTGASYESSIGTSVTVAESGGGGAIAWPVLMLMTIGIACRRKIARSRATAAMQGSTTMQTWTGSIQAPFP